jgi:hypothetical protein
VDQFAQLDGLTDGVAITRPELDSIHGAYLLGAKDTILTHLSRGLPLSATEVYDSSSGQKRSRVTKLFASSSCTWEAAEYARLLAASLRSHNHYMSVSHLLHTRRPSHLRALLYKLGNVEGEVLHRLIYLNVVELFRNKR